METPLTKLVSTSPDAENCRQAMLAAMRPYADKLGKPGMLAVASALVGQIIALQDQRTMTNAMIVEIVQRNIEYANAETITAFRDMPTAGQA